MFGIVLHYLSPRQRATERFRKLVLKIFVCLNFRIFRNIFQIYLSLICEQWDQDPNGDNRTRRCRTACNSLQQCCRSGSKVDKIRILFRLRIRIPGFRSRPLLGQLRLQAFFPGFRDGSEDIIFLLYYSIAVPTYINECLK